MRRRNVTLAALAVPATVILAGGAIAQAQPPAPATESTATTEDSREVVLRGADGAELGTVVLAAEEGKVRVTAALTGLEPGFHGFHVHEVGRCDPDAADGPFTSAGGHYVGDGGAHGHHDGDLPSLLVGEDGTAHLEVVTDAFTIAELLEGDGSALMVHSGADNFANIPDRYTSSLSGTPGADETTRATGDSGSRVACGELREEEAGPGDGLVTVSSDVSVPTTVQRITEDIEAAGLAVVAVVDHAAAAEEAGLELRPTTVIIFGNAEVGTPLIQAAQTTAIDLPQKLLVWQDVDGAVNVTYNDPAYLAERHGITGQDERLANIEQALRRLALGEG